MKTFKWLAALLAISCIAFAIPSNAVQRMVMFEYETAVW